MKRSNPLVSPASASSLRSPSAPAPTSRRSSPSSTATAPPGPSRSQEEPIPDDYNDMAAGWAPEARPEEQRPTEYGFDGTPVGSSLPGR